MSWVNNIAECIQLTKAATKIIVRWHTVSMARPWSAWAHHADDRKRIKCAAAQVLRRWGKYEVAPAFNTWIEGEVGGGVEYHFQEI